MSTLQMGEEGPIETEIIYLNPNSEIPTSDIAHYNPHIKYNRPLDNGLERTADPDFSHR